MSTTQNNTQEKKSHKQNKEGDVVEVRDLVDLPLARVKRIMKSDHDVKLISQEAVVLVTKAAVCRRNLLNLKGTFN